MTKNTLVRAAGIVAAMNMIGRLSGFVREAAIASAFGASKATDAYLVAATVPFFIQFIFGFALITAAVPVFTRYLVAGEREEGWRGASITLNYIVLALGLITLVGVLAAPAVVRLLAPGFPADQVGLASRLTVIIFPGIILMGAGMLLTGLLNAARNFALPAFAPAFANLVIILAVFWLVPSWDINGLAWGTFCSMLGLLLVQLPALRQIGFKYSFSLDYRHPAVRQIGAALIPVMLGVAVNQIYLAINRILASGLETGSISALNYAYLLTTVPLGIFVAAVVTAVFPAMSEQALKGETAALAGTTRRGLVLVSLMAIPAALGLIVLREPIVQLLFERGSFDHPATLLTAAALLGFSIGIPAQAVNLLATRAYYALHDARTPVVMGMISIVIDIGLSFPLRSWFGHAGLALANSLAAVANGMLLLWYLRRSLPEFRLRPYLIDLVKILIAATLMGVLVAGAAKIAAGYLNTGHSLGLLLQVGLAIAAGVAIFVSGILILRVSEVRFLLEMILKKTGLAKNRT